MRANRKQIAVVMLLNVVIASLVAVIFLLPSAPANGDDDVPAVVPPEVHEKLRDAQPGKADGILSETRLMGTGDESLVGAFELSGVYYIFGNSSAVGLDFDTRGGFLCRINGNGKIVGFTYFDGTMTAAGIAERGFLVGTTETVDDKEVSRLYAVDADGECAEIGRLDGYAQDIMTVGGGKTAVITRPYGSIKLTEYTLSGGEWSAGRNTRISTGLDVEYFDCYYVGGGYVLAARAYSEPKYDSLVFYTFEAGGNAAPHYYGGKDESMLTPFAVMPYDGGYLSVCRRGGVATIATVDYTFTSYRRDTLSFAFDDAELFYADKKYYACFDCPDGIVTYEIDGMLSRRVITAADGLKTACAVKADKTVLAATKENTLSAIAIGGGKVEFDIDNVNVCRAFFDGGVITLIITASGGSAVSAPNGSDVYLLRLDASRLATV